MIQLTRKKAELGKAKSEKRRICRVLLNYIQFGILHFGISFNVSEANTRNGEYKTELNGKKPLNLNK